MRYFLQSPNPPRAHLFILLLLKASISKKMFQVGHFSPLQTNRFGNALISTKKQLCLNKTEQIKTDTIFWNWFLISFRTILPNVIDLKCLN